jgi:hypothetical protein
MREKMRRIPNYKVPGGPSDEFGQGRTGAVLLRPNAAIGAVL